MDVGKNIKEIRQLKGMTQQELAEKIGITQPGIGQLEKETYPQLQTLERVASALNVSVATLIQPTNKGKNDALLLDLWQQLSDPERKAIIQLLSVIAK